MSNLWVPELRDEKPEEFSRLENGCYMQRKDIHEVVYHSLDGYQSFKGYECYCRVITPAEYEELILVAKSEA